MSDKRVNLTISNQSLAPSMNKRYKVFLVEEGDDDREKVMVGLARTVELKQTPHYDSIYSDRSMNPIKQHLTFVDYELKLTLEPDENGVYFTLENFNEPDFAPVESLGDEDSIYD